jgi:hypothetical protein
MKHTRALFPGFALILSACGSNDNTAADIETGSDPDAAGTETIQQALTEVTDKIFADETNAIYATTSDGDLLWFKDLAGDGTSSWHANSGARIGTGWNGFRHVFSGGQNIIYAVTWNGELLFYRDNANNGTWGWDAASGSVIGVGWGSFRYVFGDKLGQIYAVSTTGVLTRYQHTGRAAGTFSWGTAVTMNSPATIYNSHCATSFFNNSWASTGGGNRTIYTVQYDGSLRYYDDSAPTWCGGDVPDSNWWNSYSKMTVGGAGAIYAIGSDGYLKWLRLNNEHLITGYSGGIPIYANRTFVAGSGSSIRAGFDSLHYP